MAADQGGLTGHLAAKWESQFGQVRIADQVDLTGHCSAMGDCEHWIVYEDLYVFVVQRMKRGGVADLAMRCY